MRNSAHGSDLPVDSGRSSAAARRNATKMAFPAASGVHLYSPPDGSAHRNIESVHAEEGIKKYDFFLL